ncbi:MAG TPA: hypothetical protein VF815_03525, partial [Myxococcaceae bacterium]
MNQAMRRQLRLCHLLLVSLLLASTPAASQTLPLPEVVSAAGFQVHFPSPPIAGTWAPFTVTALGPDGRPLEAYVGTVNLRVSGTGATVDPDFHTFVSLNKGVWRFQARWLNAGPHQLTVEQGLGPTHVEPVSVLAGPIVRLGFDPLINTSRAGEPFRFTVVAIDADGLTAPYGGPL